MNRFEKLVTKKASKFPDVAVQVEETNIDFTNLTIQANPNPTEVKTNSRVVAQTTNIPSDYSATNSTTTMPEENQESTTNMIRGSPTKRIMYRYLNHKSILLDQSTYQYHLENK